MSLNSITQFLVVFVIALFGAVFNDFYNTMTDKDETVKIVRVLLSAFTGAILIFATSNYLTKYVDANVMPLLSFISGVTGFKIFEKFKNVDLVSACWKAIDIASEGRVGNALDDVTDINQVSENIEKEQDKQGDDI